jgi:putative PIN family toxin of toxin-antitoxin system
MRIVLDANVLVSGVFWAGPPGRVLSLWANDRVQVLASTEILQEYSEILARLATGRATERLSEVWDRFIFQYAVLIDVCTRVHVCRDPDDNKYLACAVDGSAEYLVSGDKDLLELKAYQGIPIVRPSRFLSVIGQSA